MRSCGPGSPRGWRSSARCSPACTGAPASRSTRGLVPAPRDAEGRERQEEHGDDLEHALTGRVVSAGSPSSCGTWTWTCSGIPGSYEVPAGYSRPRERRVGCGPGGGRADPAPVARPPALGLTSVPAGGGPEPSSMVDIPAARFRMGDDPAGRTPATARARSTTSTLDAFRIDRYAVTNARSPTFVAATGLRHRRRALRLVVRVRRSAPRRLPRHARRRGAPWWRQVNGRRLAPPEGPHSMSTGTVDHPVVQVSWNDAAGVLPRGPGRGCRPRPSGSTRHAAGSTAPRSRGATISNPAASTA